MCRFKTGPAFEKTINQPQILFTEYNRRILLTWAYQGIRNTAVLIDIIQLGYTGGIPKTASGTAGTLLSFQEQASAEIRMVFLLCLYKVVSQLIIE